MAEKSVSSDSSAPWLLAGLGIAGVGLAIFYLSTRPKTKAVQPGQIVGITVKWKNIGSVPIAQRWRVTIEDSGLVTTPQEGPWTESQTVAPGAVSTVVSPERDIPLNWGDPSWWTWGLPVKINLRLDTEGSVDKDSIKFWKEYFEIR